jgi:hypothetical protein
MGRAAAVWGHFGTKARRRQAGRWSWFVLVAPDGTPCNGGTGTAPTGRETCEALIPPGLLERGRQGVESA